MKTMSGHFLGLPGTQLGWWAVGLAAASMVLIPAWSFLLGGAWLGLICGLAGAVCALVAIIRRHERSWLVWLTLLPGLSVIFFFVGEFLFPH